MRTLLFASLTIALAGCDTALPGEAGIPLGDGGDLALPSPGDKIDLALSTVDKVDLATAPDPCGPKDPQTGFYGCAYLVGSCPSPGLTCECWENGKMVCQENSRWELILDNGCLMFGPSQGDGCLGAKDQCGGCTCDRTSESFQCPPDGGA